MKKEWMHGFVLGIALALLIFVFGFYLGNALTGNAFTDYLKSKRPLSALHQPNQQVSMDCYTPETPPPSQQKKCVSAADCTPEESCVNNQCTAKLGNPLKCYIKSDKQTRGSSVMVNIKQQASVGDPVPN